MSRRPKVDDPIITRAELAKLAGVTPQMVVKYDGLGIPRAGRARYRR